MKSLLHKYIWCYLLGFSTFGTYTCCQTSFNFHCRSTMILFSVWIIFVHAVKHFSVLSCSACSVRSQTEQKNKKNLRYMYSKILEQITNLFSISMVFKIFMFEILWCNCTYTNDTNKNCINSFRVHALLQMSKLRKAVHLI